MWLFLRSSCFLYTWTSQDVGMKYLLFRFWSRFLPLNSLFNHFLKFPHRKIVMNIFFWVHSQMYPNHPNCWLFCSYGYLRYNFAYLFIRQYIIAGLRDKGTHTSTCIHYWFNRLWCCDGEDKGKHHINTPRNYHQYDWKTQCKAPSPRQVFSDQGVLWIFEPVMMKTSTRNVNGM